MNILVFEHIVRVPGLLVALAWLAGAALAAALAGALNDRLSLDAVLAPAGGKAWALASWAACGLLIRTALAPLVPAKVFGVVYWPVHVAGWAAWSHALELTLAAAAVFVLVGSLAGGYDRWAPAPPDGRAFRLAGLGAGAGLAAALSGLVASRALFIADAFDRLGFHLTGGLVLWCVIPAFLVTGAALALAAAPACSWEQRTRLGVGAAALAVWLLPVAAAELTLRAGWDYGRAGLADAAGVARADQAPKSVTVVLARADGSPGSQRREETLSSEGLAVTRPGLEAVRRYLDLQGWRTVFLAEALAYQRRGWGLLWEPDKQMDAQLVRLGPRFPPDFTGFLANIRVAPATPENYGRLENMARAAAKARSPSVRKAGHLFQGLSDAYARFGDLESSNAWLDRIRKLMPLYEDEVNVDPIEDRHDGVIEGAVLFNGHPASAVQVGLFMRVSTGAAVSGASGLAASAWPDADGRFAFKDLTPGRYYLALRADPLILGDARLEFWNTPGVVRLQAGAMRQDLFPVEVVRPSSAPEAVPPARAALPGMAGPLPGR